MLLEEAIRDQEELLNLGETGETLKGKDYLPSIRIGLEAMKRLKLMRIHMLVSPLPGETYIPRRVGKLPSDE